MFKSVTCNIFFFVFQSLTMNSAARVESTVGEIVNLMSVDAEHVRHVYSMVWAFVACPVAIILSLVFLYNEVKLNAYDGTFFNMANFIKKHSEQRWVT